ncbi:hypothetical protein OK016_13615 [Vibrio chagasii]|nr:hypothetical protein [Vibrio chagasii]
MSRLTTAATSSFTIVGKPHTAAAALDIVKRLYVESARSKARFQTSAPEIKFTTTKRVWCF